MNHENIITIDAPNFLTIGIMGLVGLALYGVVASWVRSRYTATV